MISMAHSFPLALKLTRIEAHTKNAWSFFVDTNGVRPDFIAGQVAVLQADEERGYFAFASAPEDDGFEFLIKHNERPGLASVIFNARVGDHIALNEIVGRGFAIEAHRGGDLVFVAMGTGIAPLRSVLRHTFAARADYGRLIVLYGVRTMDDFSFVREMADDWRAHGVELKQVISQPNAEWSGPTGYVQSLLDHVTPELHNPAALVCGSQTMMEQTRVRLAELGFAPEKILTNY